ncbi:unnamed protein product [Paramecium sonneborni]|uniref:Uncharacterized protein n=1 Tax=Paramecium sonneborni TaxID=65129 RepID=A0A8S1RQS2_9CILI|nr:unnamed protein product [Paramecium sonneborni]
MHIKFEINICDIISSSIRRFTIYQNSCKNLNHKYFGILIKINKNINYLKINAIIFTLFQQDEQLYKEWLNILILSYVILQVDNFRVKNIILSKWKFLERINILLSEYCEQKIRINSFQLDLRYDRQYKFMQINPYFLIQQKEGITQRCVNQCQELVQGIECLKLKTLFQIFFNNANDELNVIFMKFSQKNIESQIKKKKAVKKQFILFN